MSNRHFDGNVGVFTHRDRIVFFDFLFACNFP